MKKKLLYILVLFFTTITISRLLILMIYKHDYYKKILEDSNNKIIYGYSAPRGRIIDRNGNIIVDNIGIKTIIYNKLNSINKSDEIDISIKLANIIDIDEGNKDSLKKFYYLLNKNKIEQLIDDNIKKKYKERKISYNEYYIEHLKIITDNMLETMSLIEKKAANIYSIISNGYDFQDKIIKKNCTDEEYSKVIELSIPGVRGELTFERVNNYPNLLDDIIGKTGLIPSENSSYYKNKGYSNDDIVGISYLEKYYEEYLRGRKAEYKINNDNTLKLVSEEKQGNDLILNIDIELQSKITNLLKDEILKSKEYKTSKYYNGSYIIVSDPSDGSIISMVGISYNNGKFYNNEIGNINKSYTVGSVVKAATISIGYKYNIIDIGYSVYDSCVKLKNKTSKCSWKPLGYVDDLKALQDSSNYYQFLIAIGLTGSKYTYDMSLNNVNDAFKIYRETLSNYGLGSITGIDLDNEEIGIIGKTISDDLLLNLSIGQYDTYTPIELSQYINTVANNGNRIKPTIMKKIITSEGNILLENKKEVLNTIDLEEKYKNRIKEGLRNVSLFGTGSYYIDKKYNASSKTGTSESILDSNLDGIADTFATTRTFVSYLPSDNPEYSIVIVSPNVDYKEYENEKTYPINMYLARNITKYLYNE